jgi:hypothetical protein
MGKWSVSRPSHVLPSHTVNRLGGSQSWSGHTRLEEKSLASTSDRTPVVLYVVKTLYWLSYPSSHSITIFGVSPVSFGTITLCVASQRVLTVVRIKYNLWFSNGCKNAFVTFGFKLEKSMKCSKQISVTMRRINWLLSGFLDSNVREFLLKIVSIQVVPPQVTNKNAKSLQNHHWRSTKYHFGNRLQVKPSVEHASEF